MRQLTVFDALACTTISMTGSSGLRNRQQQPKAVPAPPSPRSSEPRCTTHPVLQADRWGAELITDDVTRVDTSVKPFVIETAEVNVRAHSIILATGATARRLGIPSEEEFWGRGISACAICDGASPVFRGQEVGVVGGGARLPARCCASTLAELSRPANDKGSSAGGSGAGAATVTPTWGD